jgi:transposase-like protein
VFGHGANVVGRSTGSGRSIEAIARDVGRDPSTVGYWVRKHGLASTHAGRHAARGEFGEELLTELVGNGLSVRQIAAALDRSATTVRHWLRKYNLSTKPTKRRAMVAAAIRAGMKELTLHCGRRGQGRHVLRSDGYRCSRCESDWVVAWRRRVKRILVDEAGGKCVLCGYDACLAALQFHHVDPTTKWFALSREGVTRSLAEAREEAARCVLLCANCHAAVEAGLARLPFAGSTAAPLPG